MIQYKTIRSERYSASEQVQMAIEGGCGWIEFDPESVRPCDVRDILEPIIAMTKEAAAFLVISGDPVMAKEYGVHGTLLQNVEDNPMAVREDLGPEAVIGVKVRNASDMSRLTGVDVDYTVVEFDGDYNAFASFVAELRGINPELPVVADGNVSVENARMLIEAGVSGVILSRGFVDAADPVAYMAEALASVAR